MVRRRSPTPDPYAAREGSCVASCRQRCWKTDWVWTGYGLGMDMCRAAARRPTAGGAAHRSPRNPVAESGEFPARTTTGDLAADLTQPRRDRRPVHCRPCPVTKQHL
jgi:hypothetical protein